MKNAIKEIGSSIKVNINQNKTRITINILGNTILTCFFDEIPLVGQFSS
jgi:hypothetical protein